MNNVTSQSNDTLAASNTVTLDVSQQVILNSIVQSHKSTTETDATGQSQALTVTAQSDTTEQSAVVTVTENVVTESVETQMAVGEEVSLSTSGKQQYIIVTANGTATLGMGSLQQEGEESGEPGPKRFKIQGDDGQAYVLTLAEDGTAAAMAEKDVAALEGAMTSTIQLQPTKLSEIRESVVTRPEGEIVISRSDSESVLSGHLDTGKRNLQDQDVTQAWFTTRDDKNILQSKGACWKQGQWTKDEVEVLQNNINNYCKDHNISDATEIIFEMSKDERKDFYRTVARGLQRPLFSVYRRVTRMYDQKNHMGKYSPQEMERLRELRQRHGNDWAAIGSSLGRSASSVKDKCRLMKDTCNSGKWFPEEEQRLAAAVYELAGTEPGQNVVNGLSWSLVAERVITRSEKQCRTKWLNYLNWKQCAGTEWTREDDMNLLLKISTLGVADDTEINWLNLAKDWPSVRSPQWLRGKWWSLKRHIPDYQLLPFPELLEYMKTFYLHNVRVKTPISTVRLAKTEPTSDMTYIPVTLADIAGMETATEDNGAALQAFEVLQQLPTSSAAFLIAQPGVNPTISLSGSQLGTDHIIVHTLPVSEAATSLASNENVTVQLNPQPQVIISAPTSTATLNEVPSGGVTLEETTIHTPVKFEQSNHDLETIVQVEENVISQAEMTPLSTEEPNFGSHGIEEARMDSVTEVGIVSSEGESTDLVIATPSSPNFSQSVSGDGELMSSLSDPMLNSDDTDLMGTTTVSTEKETSQVDDPDLRVIDIPVS